MPAGRWTYQQNVNTQTGRVEWPTGPLNLIGGEQATWLEAWVMQRSTGASQRTFVTAFNNPNQWIADGFQNGGWKQGTFAQGPAIGIALVSTRNGNVSDSYWWADEILLV
jgi:hypothetical protein